MTMAAAIESRTAGAPARLRASRIARVDILTDLGEAESVWRALEDDTQFSTAYQRYDLLSQWQLLVGARENTTPLIAIAHDGEGRPLLLMPLSLNENKQLGTLPPRQRSILSAELASRASGAPRSGALV